MARAAGVEGSGGGGVTGEVPTEARSLGRVTLVGKLLNGGIDRNAVTGEKVLSVGGAEVVRTGKRFFARTVGQREGRQKATGSAGYSRGGAASARRFSAAKQRRCYVRACNSRATGEQPNGG
jgi:hypothetical protein